MAKTAKRAKTKKTNRGGQPSQLTLMQLCARSGGRCQFQGCNKLLFRDKVTLTEFNNTNVAHIVASSPNGPRGDAKRSHSLSNKLSNLMLMCPEHHRLIDHEAETYTEEVLKAMKAEQEQKVECVCEALNSEETHLLSLRAKIRGNKEVTVARNQMLEAILPEKRPARNTLIPLDIEVGHEYCSPEFWGDAQELLRQKFNRFVSSEVEANKRAHFSVFPLAPTPLIIKLGYMMGDKIRADVYQKRREPDTWKWQKQDSGTSFSMRRDSIPQVKKGGVFLVISLTASIAKKRRVEFAKQAGAKWIYRLCASRPGVDCISSKNDIDKFWHKYQNVIETIMNKHPYCKRISVLVSAPVSAAFEIGRRYMPGIYPIMDIYEEHFGKISKALEIGGKNE